MVGPRALVPLALLGALTLGASEARADLRGDAERLAAAYRSAGAEVELLPTRFALSGSTVTVSLPRAPEGAPRCASLIVLSERIVPFSARPTLPPSLGISARLRDAESGVLELVDCNGRTLGTGALDVVMGKRHGALELVLARHAPDRRPETLLVLPERATGPLPEDEAEIGDLTLAPIADRQRRAEASARRDGATFLARVDHEADARGAGHLLLRLRQGCHRVAVLTSERRGVDVDADIRLHGAAGPLAQDGSQAPNARLAFCTGDDGDVALRYVGAGAGADVRVIVAYWPLPEGLPTVVGPRARGGLARALSRRGAPAVTTPPAFLAKGAPGLTVLPVEVAPETCYLAAMALGGGSATAARLVARLRAGRRHDATQEGQTAATAVSFCTGAGERHVALDVDLRAESAWWALALWRVSPAPRSAR